LQKDNNLVLYDQDHKAIWAANTGGHTGHCVLRAQNDGNVVLYNQAGKAIWTTGTYQFKNSMHYGVGQKL
jgi:hypothetical protein